MCSVNEHVQYIESRFQLSANTPLLVLSVILFMMVLMSVTYFFSF